ncbi:MAG TPA: Fe-S cluster assembly protein SufD [Methylophaga aminisulfidivorans]|uniref:Fe-S cluster assembly protein SufD n=3 Tax=root TaxID=1 RepID=A0A7C1VQP8_9GAMM|nr:Fe-S cluster assembly protein SufD [Methylophaga aminisulfidivorans]
MKQLTDISTPFADVYSKQELPGQNLPWLQQLRTQAHGQFERQGLPSKKVEEWKYTSLWALTQQSFTHQTSQSSLSEADCSEIALMPSAYRVVIVDGVFEPSLSTISELEKGIKISPLSQSFDDAKQVIGEQISLDKPGFNAINTMMMNEGVFVHVESNQSIEKPIEVLVINTGKQDALATHLRHVIQLDEGSKVTLIEHYIGLSDSEAGLTDVVTEVSLAKKATLNHFKIQRESLAHFHIATLAAKQSAESTWNTNNISLGGRLARNDIHSQLLGEAAHVRMDGLYLVAGKQHVDNHTHIDHAVPNTTSEEVYKGVLDDESHAVFNGKVHVHKDAQKTDANQSNRNLLLSRHCEIDTKPEMEIYADDVKCGHGSTVGQLDEQHLFFLRARGLSETSARSLLTYAFAVEVLQRIADESVRESLSTVIEKRLPKGA